MTKIFSTPKEVLTKVEAEIQTLLDSYCGNNLVINKAKCTPTVIRELDRAGWVVRDKGNYADCIVYPKKWRYHRARHYEASGFQTFSLVFGGITGILTCPFAWEHLGIGMVSSGLVYTAICVICLFGVWKDV